MPRQVICGFETGDLVEAGTSGGTVSVQNTTVRTGGYALRCNPTTGNAGWANFTGLSLATTYARFYFRYATKPATLSEEIFAVRDSAGSYKFSVRLDSAGNLSAYDTATTLITTGATVLAANTWYRIEVKVLTGASAAYEVKVDGVSEMSGTADLSTQNATIVYCGKFTNRNSKTVDFFYDDVAVDDVIYPGPGAVVAMLPDGNGSSTAWTGTYTDVDEVPHNSDTDYIVSTANGDVETVTLQSAASAGLSGQQVRTVKLCAVARRDGGTNGAIRLRARSGGVNSDGTADIATTASYAIKARLLAADPADNYPWTPAGLDALEIGVVERSNNLSRATLLCAMVEYEAVSGVRKGLLLRRFA